MICLCIQRGYCIVYRVLNRMGVYGSVWCVAIVKLYASIDFLLHFICCNTRAEVSQPVDCTLISCEAWAAAL